MSRVASYRGLLVLLALGALLVAVGLSCSAGQLLGENPARAVPTPSRTPQPTFTPLGGLPAAAGTQQPPQVGELAPGVTAIVPGTAGDQQSGSTNLVLYATPTGQYPPGMANPGLSPLATGTPRPELTPTRRVTTGPSPTPGPTPYLVVVGAEVQARRGPAPTFELLGTARQGQQFMLLARTPDSQWWQVCCVANQPAWIPGDRVRAEGPYEAAPVLPFPPTPTRTLTPTPTRTLTPSPTPAPPFDIARGPEFPIKRDDGVMVMWAKVYEGPADNERPLAGYILKVFRNDVDVSLPIQSHARESGFDTTGPTQGNYSYNLKFEMNSGGEADWQIYLARPDGSRVSPISKFTTMGDSYRNLTVFIAYVLAR